MPLRTEEALRWLMEDIGLRKSDAGAIRASLKSKAGEVKLEPGILYRTMVLDDVDVWV